MLSYTFTKREKALLLALAIVLLVIVWFVFVYQGTTNANIELDGEIATVQNEISMDETRVAQMAMMKSTIEERKAAGVKPTAMPDYDNMQRLMAELNKIMSAADNYALTFDELTQDEQGHILRGIGIDYGASSTAKAESLVNALAKGAYPCRIDSVSIADSTAKQANARGNSQGSNVNATVHVTFFENLPAGVEFSGATEEQQ